MPFDVGGTGDQWDVVEVDYLSGSVRRDSWWGDDIYLEHKGEFWLKRARNGQLLSCR